MPAPRRRRGGDAARYCCFGCRLARGLTEAGEASSADSHAPPADPVLLRLGAGVFLAMNIMVFSWFFYSRQIYGGGDAAMAAEPWGGALASLFAYLLLLLCTGVVVVLGAPLAGDALSALVQRDDAGRLRPSLRPDANLLILMGVSAAYALSAWHTVRGQGHLYFDTAAMILVLVTLGGYLDARAKRRAAIDSDALLADLPTTVWLRDGDGVRSIDAPDLRPGDVVRVRPGETVPADGVVAEGAAQVDESVLTGESRPRLVELGGDVLAGGVSTDGLLWVRVQQAQGERVIDQVRKLLEQARLRQPTIQRLADRVAGAFVPLVSVIALSVFAWHASSGAAARGLLDALSVLLISCPCALGLAAPLACHSALGRAARRGVLIDSAATLERAAAVRAVMFDKTGTLTESRLRVKETAVADGLTEPDALALAAAVESGSVHPVARALVAESQRQNLAPQTADQARVLPGRGVEAIVDGVLFRVGNAAMLTDLGLHADGLSAADPTDDDCTHVYLCDDRRVMARFALSAPIRREARPVVAALRRSGVDVTVLTGDAAAPAQSLARALDVEVVSDMLPADKLTHLERARGRRGMAVAFVGDGINDAPAMGAADVGVAVGHATDLARQAGHVHLISNDLTAVPMLFDLSRDTVRRIRLSLAWAFGYNAVGVTLAAVGMLSPIFAASAMVVSSLVIVTTSRRAGEAATEQAGHAHPAIESAPMTSQQSRDSASPHASPAPV